MTMIGFLEGKLGGIAGGSALVICGGVGYKVAVSAYALGKIAGQETVALYIHTHVREDQLNLFGFLDEDELEMFELLISVSGIGPKAALGILSIADPNTIRTAIVHKDASLLTRVSGVGKKTAEKVIVELQNKVKESELHGTAQAVADQDALEALTAMGYTVGDAREALKLVAPDIRDVGARIRQALKNLGKK